MPSETVSIFDEIRKRCSNFLKKLLPQNFGIGHIIDTGNFWVFPGLSLFFNVIYWTTKLSNIALDETKCTTGNFHNVFNEQLNAEANKYCYYSKRYYVNFEPIQFNQEWKDRRQVKSLEWILWFWVLILFFMTILPAYIWKLFIKIQDIDFDAVKIACQKVVTTEVAQDRQQSNQENIDKINLCLNEVKSSIFSFILFMVFKFMLACAPLFLLLFIMPKIIGDGYGTWGFDVIKALLKNEEWYCVSPKPIFGSYNNDELIIPLMPKITYCDYHVLSHGDVHIFTYRCYTDTTWHERTAFLTWVMLLLTAIINILHFLLWFCRAICMFFSEQYLHDWIKQRWLGGNGCWIEPRCFYDSLEESNLPKNFSMDKMLLLYFVENLTNRSTARNIVNKLFVNKEDSENELLPSNNSSLSNANSTETTNT